MKEFLKNHWKDALIIIFALFSVTKCTQSCSRDDQNKKVLHEKDSIENLYTSHGKVIDSLVYEIKVRDNRITSLEEENTKKDELLHNMSTKKTSVVVNNRQ